MSEETKKDQANGLESESNNPEITTNQEATQEEAEKSQESKSEAETIQPENTPQEETISAAPEAVSEGVKAEPAPEIVETLVEEVPTEVHAAPEPVAVEAPDVTETKDAKEVIEEPVEDVNTESANEEASKDETAEIAATDEEEILVTDEKEVAEELVEEIDYASLSREELVTVVEELAQDEKFRGVEDVLNQVIPLFFAMEKGIKEAAQNKFHLDGGAEDDFEFNHDEFYSRFDGSVKLIRDKRAKYYKERERRETCKQLTII